MNILTIILLAVQSVGFMIRKKYYGLEQMQNKTIPIINTTVYYIVVHSNDMIATTTSPRPSNQLQSPLSLISPAADSLS